MLERSVHAAAESGAPAPTAPDETENLNPPGTAGRPAAIPERVGPYYLGGGNDSLSTLIPYNDPLLLQPPAQPLGAGR